MRLERTSEILYDYHYDRCVARCLSNWIKADQQLLNELMDIGYIPPNERKVTAVDSDSDSEVDEEV